jgi:hypothetical protein
MDIFEHMSTFLKKYADKWDWVALSANPSVPQRLKDLTKEMPWMQNVVTMDYCKETYEQFTREEEDHWNFMEARANPYWNWEKFSEEQLAHVPETKMARWFFILWSRNVDLFRCNDESMKQSINRYCATIRIQRTWRRCISSPYHPMGIRRLHREFESMEHIKT